MRGVFHVCFVSDAAVSRPSESKSRATHHHLSRLGFMRSAAEFRENRMEKAEIGYNVPYGYRYPYPETVPGVR